MVAYSFKARFAAPILAGTKAQTIRAERTGRSRHARPGEQMQLFTGMRTKACRRIATPLCEAIDRIMICLPTAMYRPSVIVSSYQGDAIGQGRSVADLDAFAVSDGFRDFDDMAAFWRATHAGVEVFHGVLIRWQPLVPADALDIAAMAA